MTKVITTGLRPTDSVARTPIGENVAIFSRGLYRLPSLANLLGTSRIVYRPTNRQANQIDAVIGWGNKRNTQAAMHYAKRHRLPYWRAEDGFIRSVGLGVTGDPPLSIVLDDLGIYYDARSPSRLETILNYQETATDPLQDRQLLGRARKAIDLLLQAEVSKYNNTPISPPSWSKTSFRGRILVVDQTYGDLSVQHGLATPDSFGEMLQAALADHPDAQIVIKTHPDVICGKKRGYLSLPPAHPRIQVLSQPVNPIALIRQVDAVYCVTSQMGLEALLLGKPVTCFGAPFYAGWGLTIDRCGIPRRNQKRTIEQLFAATYLLYPRYIDPDSQEVSSLERVVEHLALQRQQFTRNTGRIFCFGFYRHFWKRTYLRTYLRSPQNQILFPWNANRARSLGLSSTDHILIWGQRCSEKVKQLATETEVPIWRMEDGFLRSVGLGSDFAVPASLVVDPIGIYYDPSRPSELERILEHETFSESELERAQKLRTQIVDRGLSKYNVGTGLHMHPPQGKQIILVPGQVEEDASIQLGCRDIRTNMQLLEQVRKHNPHAYIIYKPHPDVLGGNRRGHTSKKQAYTFCDHWEDKASLHACLMVADQVHTLTSLVGFDALLRGIPVTVYGQPFYASWGLTRDRHPLNRRTRKLTLDQLVAGTLLRYPRYVNHQTGHFTTPESVIAMLCQERKQSTKTHPIKTSWPRRQIRKLANVYRGLIHAS